MRGVGLTNKSNTDVFINELVECHEFGLGKGVHGTNRRGGTFLQVDLQIVRMMRGQRIGLCFAKYVGIVVILFGNVREVRDFVRDRGRTSGDRGIGKMNPKTLRSWKPTGTDEGGCTYQGNAWRASEKRGSAEGAELPWQTTSGSDMTDQGAVDGR